MSRLLALAALPLLAVPAIAHAQDGPGNSASQPGTDPKPEVPLAATPNAAPAGATDALLDGVSFDLEVGEDQKSVTMQFGQTGLGAWRAKRSDNSSNWLITATVPIDPTQNLVSRSTLDTLAGGSKLSLTFSFLHFPSAAGRLNDPDGRFRSVIVPAAFDACKEVEEDDSVCQLKPGEPRTWLPGESVKAYARKYLDDGRVNRSLFPTRWRLGGEATLGSEKFEFVEPGTLANQNPAKLQFAGSAFFVLYPSDGMSTVVLRGEYQNGFEARDLQTVCKPVVVDPAIDCIQERRLAPIHTERVNLSFEYRRVIDLGLPQGMIAISPKATYDTLSNEFQVELPLYFVPAKAGPVAPGLKISYSSRDEQVQFGAFLKSTFAF